ncbi:AAA family ATPase [Serratia fonticola]|uniref:AAA family ATPase n=1 Tax=Serratia fonticola TaxID=47917 RepID=UPI001AE4C6C1|nr:AAA family ATPase [Serratia fonticola]MBP1004627.1 AAA family ATPase [Serratia fonticola]MBP1013803.1 AAA family ATPase [Serratia fonticola]
MITEIALDGVASYKTKVSLKTDKKVNIIYGLNGSGKSTFSNYFYKLKDGENQYSKCSCNCSGETILVYNQQFIKDNFYEVGNLKGIFSLSKENKEAKEKIELATKELEAIRDDKLKIEEVIKKEEDKVTEAKLIAQGITWKIKQDYSGGDRVLEFCLKRLMGSSASLYNHISAIPLPIKKPNKTIAELKDEASAIDGSTAAKQTLCSEISLDELSEDNKYLLNMVIVGNEDSPVAGLIDKLKNSDWVNDGLRFIDLIDDDRCPFCQAHTMTDSLIREIRSYFDESYQQNIKQLNEIQRRYAEIIEEFPTLDGYNASPYAKNFLAQLTSNHSEIQKLILINVNLIKDKINTPSMKVKLHDLTQSISDFNSIVGLINKLVVEHNNKIDNSDNELERIKVEFWDILRCEYDQTISNFDLQSASSQKIIESNRVLAKEKADEEKRKELDVIEYQKSTVNIKEAISHINQGLSDLGITDFYIEGYKDDLYQIIRSGATTDVFSSLSEGEKMIISFLYFRELFRGKQTVGEVVAKKIAIIDDPVSSLSHIFVYNIGQLLKNHFFNSDSIEQVFVLTHSLYFFYELTDSVHTRRKENQNLFRLTKNSNGTLIERMKYEEIQNDYQSYWSVINDDKQPPALIANCMRNIVEYFFNFVQKSDLSNVMQKPELKDEKFQAFIRYINRESHSLGQNIFDFKEFDYNNFKSGLKLVFEHTGYAEHYQKMSTIGA